MCNGNFLEIGRRSGDDVIPVASEEVSEIKCKRITKRKRTLGNSHILANKRILGNYRFVCCRMNPRTFVKMHQSSFVFALEWLNYMDKSIFQTEEHYYLEFDFQQLCTNTKSVHFSFSSFFVLFIYFFVLCSKIQVRPTRAPFDCFHFSFRLFIRSFVSACQ